MQHFPHHQNPSLQSCLNSKVQSTQILFYNKESTPCLSECRSRVPLLWISHNLQGMYTIDLRGKWVCALHTFFFLSLSFSDLPKEESFFSLARTASPSLHLSNACANRYHKEKATKNDIAQFKDTKCLFSQSFSKSW